MIACQELGAEVGTSAASKALDIVWPIFYRRIAAKIDNAATVRPAPPRTLSVLERQIVLNVLHFWMRSIIEAPDNVRLYVVIGDFANAGYDPSQPSIRFIGFHSSVIVLVFTHAVDCES
jgi:hypothetical protein